MTSKTVSSTMQHHEVSSKRLGAARVQQRAKVLDKQYRVRYNANHTVKQYSKANLEFSAVMRSLGNGVMSELPSNRWIYNNPTCGRCKIRPLDRLLSIRIKCSKQYKTLHD